MNGPSLDFQTHLAALEANGLLVRVNRPINKDTELHPLVRWQFLGCIPEDERRAFLFTNVVDSRGRHYDIPVAVGALAASAKIYALGMGRAIPLLQVALPISLPAAVMGVPASGREGALDSTGSNFLRTVPRCFIRAVNSCPT